MLFGAAEHIWDQLGRLVEVVAPQQRDPPRVTEILDSRLQHSLERHQPGERERRKQNETESVEGRAHATSRCD